MDVAWVTKRWWSYFSTEQRSCCPEFQWVPSRMWNWVANTWFVKFFILGTQIILGYVQFSPKCKKICSQKIERVSGYVCTLIVQLAFKELKGRTVNENCHEEQRHLGGAGCISSVFLFVPLSSAWMTACLHC